MACLACVCVAKVAPLGSCWWLYIKCAVRLAISLCSLCCPFLFRYAHSRVFAFVMMDGVELLAIMCFVSFHLVAVIVCIQALILLVCLSDHHHCCVLQPLPFPPHPHPHPHGISRTTGQQQFSWWHCGGGYCGLVGSRCGHCRCCFHLCLHLRHTSQDAQQEYFIVSLYTKSLQQVQATSQWSF